MSSAASVKVRELDLLSLRLDLLGRLGPSLGTLCVSAWSLEGPEGDTPANRTSHAELVERRSHLFAHLNAIDFELHELRELRGAPGAPGARELTSR